nr:MAG TPA: hypothetical protein [Caudoviricetes sp.]
MSNSDLQSAASRSMMEAVASHFIRALARRGPCRASYLL